ncbi:MAG: hypothetical protein EOP24_25920 [Hyphomicrobiales bacterium]|nr:MAG: hypothetical protein EOP24_25920 [Hyphomicrobiales bacterium]
MEIFDATQRLLTRMGFTALRASVRGREVLIFEDDSVIGFVFSYLNAQSLIADWGNDSEAAVSAHQFALRRAGQKAWNTYVVLLASGDASYAEMAAISAIEEDLTGTRKIARADIKDISDVEAALLPLLPLQSAPKLDAVDMVLEIRQRATELPPRAVEAFLSGVEESVVLQVIEETT